MEKLSGRGIYYCGEMQMQNNIRYWANSGELSRLFEELWDFTEMKNFWMVENKFERWLKFNYSGHKAASLFYDFVISPE